MMPVLPLDRPAPRDWHDFLSWVASEIEQDRVPQFAGLRADDRERLAALLRASPGPWGAH
jgi:hypothetical protein